MNSANHSKQIQNKISLLLKLKYFWKYSKRAFSRITFCIIYFSILTLIFIIIWKFNNEKTDKYSTDLYIFNKYHSKLSEILLKLENSIHQTLIFGKKPSIILHFVANMCVVFFCNFRARVLIWRWIWCGSCGKYKFWIRKLLL